MRRLWLLLLLLALVPDRLHAAAYPGQTDKTGFTEGSGGMVMMGCDVNDTRGGNVSEDNATVARCTNKGDLKVSQSASTSASGTLQSSATGNGNGTSLSTDGMASAVLTVNCSSCSGGTTVNFEGTEDNSNWTAVTAVQIGTATLATTTTTSGITFWELPVANFVNLRARISSYSAGTITITGHTSPMPWNAKVVNANLLMGGTAADGNSGNKSAQTQRIVIATDQPQLTNALKVDGSAVTQPVSAASLPLPSGASTAAKQPALGTAGSASSDVISVQGIASMTPVQTDVTKVGGSSVSTAATGVQKVGVVGNGGATVDSTVGAGTAPTNQVVTGCLYNSTEPSPSNGQALAVQCDSKGRERQVIMDAAGNTRGANVNSSNQLSVSVDNSNVSTNIAQMNGVTVTMGNGASGTGVQRVTLANDGTGVLKQWDGTNTANVDACASVAHTKVAINQTASTKLISQTSAKTNYICNIVLVVQAAEIVNIVEGTGSTCGTSTAAIMGSTTASQGMSFAANGGFTMVGGNAAVITGSGTNLDLCLTQNGSNRVSGYLDYVQR